MDVILITWRFSDHIGDVNWFGGSRLILQAFETLPHLIAIDLDLDLTGKCDIDIESIRAQTGTWSTIYHDGQRLVSLQSITNCVAEDQRLMN